MTNSPNPAPAKPSTPPPAPPSTAATVAPADPFASAKDNLRDTVKWLATTFAGLAAVVLAGTSLTGVSHLKGASLVLALVGGGLGLLCVILASGVMLRLLTSESFFVSDLNTQAYANLRAFLNAHAPDILPPQLGSVEEVLRDRALAMKQARDLADHPESKEFQSADRFLAALTVPLSRLTNLAHFEVLRGNLKAAEPKLFFLAIGALIGLGAFAVFTGTLKERKLEADSDATIQLQPGTNWSRVGIAFASVCGDKELKAQLLRTPQPGWVKVRLLAPEECAGIVVSMPAKIIVPHQVSARDE